MKRKMFGKRRYYNSVTDDFVRTGSGETPVVIGGYKYIHQSWLFRAWSAFFYHAIARPVFWLISKILYRAKVEGKENARALRKMKTGFAVFGNHVHYIDAPMYYVYAMKKNPHVIVAPNSIRVAAGRIVLPWVGALPLPEDRETMRSFGKAVDASLKNGSLLVLPEAHEWPYFAGVRPFSETSFRYASKNAVPVVPVCLTWRKRAGKNGHKKHPYMTIHVGAPLLAPPELDERAQAKFYCEAVYDWMAERCNNPDNYAAIHYVQTDIPVNMDFQLTLNKEGVEYTP